MIELVWFFAGVAVTTAGALLLLRHRARTSAALSAATDARRRRASEQIRALVARFREQALAARAPAPVPAATAPPPAAPSALAQAIAQELATIVSGVEGGAHRLIEAAANPGARLPAAESLWLAVRRLRHFHDKLDAFVQPPPARRGPAIVEALLVGLRAELEASQLGLTMAWSLPRTLPALQGHADVLAPALLFLTQSLLQLESGALRLTINVEPGFEHDAPHIEIELQLEWDEDPTRQPHAEAPSVGHMIAHAAAVNLLRSQDGTVEIDHEPGHCARALLRLPAIDAAQDAAAAATELAAAAAAEEPLPAPEPARHGFGGVLLLESDPSVRSMLATELKAWGRAVFACADGAAARALMQATPDRFEMLVVDRAARLHQSDALAATAARLCPELKVFVLSEPADQPLPAELGARVHRIKKPFGVQELRRALATVLAS